jgi:hypothetical protein
MKRLGRIVLLFSFFALACASPQSAAQALQKKLWSASGAVPTPVGWPAQSAHIAIVFANQIIPEGTTIYSWSEASQNYIIVTYDFGEWSDPLHILQTARGFYIRTPFPYEFTLNYTPLVGSVYQVTMVPDKLYFLTYAWELGVDGFDDPENGEGYFLEIPWHSRYYVHPHLYWPGGCDEEQVLWTLDGSYDHYNYVYRPPSGQDPCTGMWGSINMVPPYLASRWHQPFWYRNTTGFTKTWTMYSSPGQY